MPRNGSSGGHAYPVEDFLQALTAQLDRAQDTLALKVRAGRPLTWALKDLSIDLHVFVEVDPAGRVLMRSAGANEQGASTVHLNLAAITRPMVEENTLSIHDETDPRTLEELRTAGHLDEEDRRKLDMVGIRTVGQLKRLSSETTPAAVEATIGLPVDRLRALLEQAARPAVTGNEVLRRDGGPLLRIQGVNLSDGSAPEVRLSGDLVEVLEAKPQQLVVRPRSHHDEGPIEVRVGGERATGWFRIARKSPRAESNGHGQPAEGA
jgi:hypothetical protein